MAAVASRSSNPPHAELSCQVPKAIGETSSPLPPRATVSMVMTVPAGARRQSPRRASVDLGELDEPVIERVERGRRVAAQAGVDLGGLQDRARGGGQPAEALRGRQGGDRPGAGRGVADLYERVEMVGEIGDRHIGVERPQARVVEADPGAEKAELPTEEHD